MQAIQKQPDLERLFHEVAEDLTRYFSRRHGNSGESPRDLVQETFLEMAKGIDKGLAPVSARAYLFGIARRVSQAAWRRCYREREMVSDCIAESVGTPVPDWRMEATREVIESLPLLHREVLDLRFTHSLSYAEIAEALDIPVGTVRSRLHNAVRAVRDRLTSDESLES